MTGRKFAAGSSSSTQRSRGKRDDRALPDPVLQRVRCSQGRRPERYPAQPTVRPARTFAHGRRPDQIPRSTTDQARFVTRSPRIHATSDDASTTDAGKNRTRKGEYPGRTSSNRTTLRDVTTGDPEGTGAAANRRQVACSLLSQDHLRELLAEVQDGIEHVVATTRVRMDALLDAVLSVSSGLDLDRTLNQIVQAATELVDASTAPWESWMPMAGWASS